MNFILVYVVEIDAIERKFATASKKIVYYYHNNNIGAFNILIMHYNVWHMASSIL